MEVKTDKSKRYYSDSQLFVFLLFFAWIKGCVDFQRLAQVHKKTLNFALNPIVASAFSENSEITPQLNPPYEIVFPVR